MDQGETETGKETSDRPRLLGPRRRWLVLVVWGALSLGVVVVQHLMENRTEIVSGTVALLVTIGIGLSVSAGRFIPEMGTRSMVRVWGFYVTFLAILYSFMCGLVRGLLDIAAYS